MTHSMEKDTLIECIDSALNLLAKNDLPIISETCDTAEHRQVYEVCVNHRLAMYLSMTLRDKISTEMTVDLEFNRNGYGEKCLQGFDGLDKVRPDIIVHNRRFGGDARNLLVVECKHASSSPGEREKDEAKVKRFIVDPTYSYEFGMVVVYSDKSIAAKMFAKKEEDEPGVIHETMVSLPYTEK